MSTLLWRTKFCRNHNNYFGWWQLARRLSLSTCQRQTSSDSKTVESSCNSAPPFIITSNRSMVDVSSKQVRQAFIDYFVHQHAHLHYPSSSVKPATHDQSLLFVNAGMNQFKPIFLNQLHQTEFEHFCTLKRVANSQKCIRVGGKHCDLEAVGADFTHHTFFEMLGNWSFNDYFKREACQMAWSLLTTVYGIDAQRLFVTIFAGDNQLGLQTDLEAYEIWRSIGVPAERIVPLGIKDNFWEMGDTGPCGICTEIHYQLKPCQASAQDSATFHQELLANSFEIWNIVFIQFNKDANGTLHRLDKNFVDTGMGLERILSLVQSVPNNYATDLFLPYFDKLASLCRWPEYTHRLDDPKDVAYRIVADHSRMAAVAIADQIIPDDRGAGYLLRRVIRRAVDSLRTLATSKSLPEGLNESALLRALVETTINKLGEAFPVLIEQASLIDRVIDEEVRLYNTALQRHTTLMKLADSLQISLFESATSNESEIERKCNELNQHLDKIEESLCLSPPHHSQKELEQARRELRLLGQLSTTDPSLSIRFGLTSKNIENLLSRLDHRLTKLELNSDKIIQQVIELFELEARQRLITSGSSRYFSLNISNQCVNHLAQSVDFMLLKIASDLFGNEHPLMVILLQQQLQVKTDPQFENAESLLVQLTVPQAENQEKLDAITWFERAIQENLDFDVREMIQIFPIKNKRTQHRLVKYRIKMRIADSTDQQAMNIEIIASKLEQALRAIAEQCFP